MKVWTGENEMLQRDELEQIQLERLQSTLNRAYKDVSFYKRHFDSHGVHPREVGSIEDIEKVPFMTRVDLGDNYPYGLFAVPLRDIVRINPSPGTTIKPVVVGYTKADLKTRNTVTARFLTAAGVSENDIVQICFNPALSGWGRALKEGAESIGASVMPMSAMSTSKQLMAMEDFKTSVLLTTPSYALHMISVMETIGMDRNRFALKTVLLAGEALKQEVREKLQTTFGVEALAGYGPSDVMGPGIAYECQHKDGLHISEDHFIMEIVAPETGEPRPNGKEGEIVLTTLTARAFPLIRFRTGDLACAQRTSCPCGRTLHRISPITGYTGDVLTIRGVKVHPLQIEEILKTQMASSNGPPRFVVHLYKENHLDMVEVLLEITESAFSDEVKEVEHLLTNLRNSLFRMLGIEATIRMVERTTLEGYGLASGGVIDER